MKKILLGSFFISTFATKTDPNKKGCSLEKIDDFAPKEVDSLVRDLDEIKRELESFQIGGYTRAVYVLGQTGVGKSTLINYLLKAQMKYDGNKYSCSINP